LSAALGFARALGVDPDLGALIEALQRDLHAVAARLADPAHRIASRVTKVGIGPEAIARLESEIDRLEAEVPPLQHFILAGGSDAGAALHLARTICRRAERRMVSLGVATDDPEVLVYANRLSDLLFVMARVVNHRAGIPESEW
jgi:cob(I)alamin adenosyltransferase